MTRMLKEKEAAMMLGLSQKTLQGWRWKGVGPRWAKLNRAVRYSESELEAYLQDASRQSTSENEGVARDERS